MAEQRNGRKGSCGEKVEAGVVETVRSRWSPKPEQILILESIFNSGMVNPPKEETVRIRRLLEKFGAVGDANVFYWFQNRRSRSRRRLRQLQAGLLPAAPHGRRAGSSSIPLEHCSSTLAGSPFPASSSSSPPLVVQDGSADDLFSISRQMSIPVIGADVGSKDPPDPSGLRCYQTGLMTIYINGIPWEVPRGPFDAKAMFGSGALLVDSSGEVIQMDECGMLLRGLEMGESYFMVPHLGF